MAQAVETARQVQGDEPACLMKRCTGATGHVEGWWVKSCLRCPAEHECWAVLERVAPQGHPSRGVLWWSCAEGRLEAGGPWAS